MVAVVFPSSVARITSLTLQPMHSGDFRHNIPSTGASKIFRLGFGFWAGSITFGEMDNWADGQKIEAFLASLDGGVNTVKIPLDRIKKNPRTAIVARNAMTSSDVGQYFTNGDRLYIVTAVNGGVATLWPGTTIAASAAMTPATSIKIRQEAESPLMPHNPSVNGPWTLQFREAI